MKSDSAAVPAADPDAPRTAPGTGAAGGGTAANPKAPPQGDWVITPAAPEDLDALEAVEEACFAIPWSRQSLTCALEDPHTLVLAARLGREVAGYAGMQTVLDQGDIGNLAVLPRYRRLGLGRTLLAALLAAGEGLGLSCVLLEVRASNRPALSLYRQLGFVQVGRRRDYYDHPREDALLLTYHYPKENPTP